MRPASWLLRVCHDHLGVPDDVTSVGWLVWHFLTHHYTRYVLAWVGALGLAGFSLYHFYHSFRDPKRRDGGGGHATIDFGGQYLMGRLLLEGRGRDLYNRTAYWQVAWRVYPPEDAAPPLTPELRAAGLRQEDIPGDHRDAAGVITCYMFQYVEEDLGRYNRVEVERVKLIAACAAPVLVGDPLGAATALTAAQSIPEYTPQNFASLNDQHLGGPLYPPVNAFAYAPLALLSPRAAYHAMQVLLFGFALLAGYGIRVLTDNRIWWPVAFALIMLYPGFRGSDQLGQNAPVSFAILVWGWALAARGHQVWGGVVWGLFAFKPVWGMTFFLIPLLTGRWRMCLTMVATGAMIAWATLPFVGLDCWLDWLKVGRIAAELYNVDKNWVFLSRDLLGIPRRALIDFDLREGERDSLAATLASWGLWLAVLEVTVLVAARRRDLFRDPTGPVYAFLFLGASLLCYHFMYYDIMLSGVGALLLLARPGRLVEPTVLTASPAAGPGPAALPDWRDYVRPQLPRAHPLLGRFPAGGAWVLNSFVLTALFLLLVVEHVFGWLNLTASIAGPVLPTVTRSGGATLSQPQNMTLVFTTYVYGPPWDTLVLLGLWAYAGALTLRAPRANKDPV